MSIRLKFREDAEQGTPVESSTGDGQSVEVLQQLAKLLTPVKTDEQSNTPPAPTPQTFAERHGIDDEQLAKMKEDGYGWFLDVLDGEAQQRDSDMALVVDLLSRNQTATQTQFAELGKLIEKATAVDPDREWSARGYGVFEQNPDVTKEYLEEVSAAAGPLVGDAVAEFEAAQENNDWQFLDKVKAGVEQKLRSVAEKQHTGIGGSSVTPLSKTEREKMEAEEQEYQKARAEAKAELDPVKRLDKILSVGGSE